MVWGVGVGSWVLENKVRYFRNAAVEGTLRSRDSVRQGFRATGCMEVGLHLQQSKTGTKSKIKEEVNAPKP